MLQGTLARMDVVTREEFDVQAGVLARTRERVEQLLERLEELERGLQRVRRRETRRRCRFDQEKKTRAEA